MYLAYVINALNRMIRNSRGLMDALAFLSIIICYIDRSDLSYTTYPLEL